MLKPSKCSCCTPSRCWMQSHCICSNIHHYTFPVPQQGQGSCRIFMANFYNTYRLSTIFVSNFSNSLDLKTIFPDQVRAQSHTHTFWTHLQHSYLNLVWEWFQVQINLVFSSYRASFKDTIPAPNPQMMFWPWPRNPQIPRNAPSHLFPKESTVEKRHLSFPRLSPSYERR